MAAREGVEIHDGRDGREPPPAPGRRPQQMPGPQGLDR